MQCHSVWSSYKPPTYLHELAYFPLTQAVKLQFGAGILVLQPDVLLSGTRIAGSFKCPRQAVLEERFGGNGNAKAVEGTLLHNLLQVCDAASLHNSIVDERMARLAVRG